MVRQPIEYSIGTTSVFLSGSWPKTNCGQAKWSINLTSANVVEKGDTYVKVHLAGTVKVTGPVENPVLTVKQVQSSSQSWDVCMHKQAGPVTIETELFKLKCVVNGTVKFDKTVTLNLKPQITTHTFYNIENKRCLSKGGVEPLVPVPPYTVSIKFVMSGQPPRVCKPVVGPTPTPRGPVGGA